MLSIFSRRKPGLLASGELDPERSSSNSENPSLQSTYKKSPSSFPAKESWYHHSLQHHTNNGMSGVDDVDGRWAEPVFTWVSFVLYVLFEPMRLSRIPSNDRFDVFSPIRFNFVNVRSSLSQWTELSAMIRCIDGKWAKMECEYNPYIFVLVIFFEFGFFPITLITDTPCTNVVRECRVVRQKPPWVFSSQVFAKFATSL